MSAVAAALGLSRPNLSSGRKVALRRRGRPPAPDQDLVAEIRALVADLPTYGYRRVHALLRRRAERDSLPVPNVKRVYRVMRLHGLLLQRHAGAGERRHDGRVAVEARNTRWCSDGLEIACWNGERVRVALTVLDYDDLRGALRGDAKGRALRGDLAALRALQAASA